MNYRERLKDKKRIVIKIGSSSLTHSETGRLNLRKLEVLARELSDLRNQGKDVILVSSGAIATGVAALGMHEKPTELKGKQACAAVGQARLMMIYQKLFSEYNQLSAQILMTKNTMVNNVNRKNAQNTFDELLSLGVIPIVNENDSISTYELQNLEKFGDNDTLSAMVAALVRADLLILLSDIDGLFTDDPNTNPDAKFIDVVENLDDNLLNMGKGTSGSKVGTGGMATKLTAAQIASAAGVDMVIANGADFHIIHKITEGRRYGTLFVSQSKEEVYLIDIIDRHSQSKCQCLQTDCRRQKTGGRTMEVEKIDRINALAHKAKSVGLTEEEKKERELLRKEYIASVRMNLRAQLDNVDVQQEDGTIINLGERYGIKKRH